MAEKKTWKRFKEKDKRKIICECGMSIFGVSGSHAQSNLKIHQKSKMHKNIMANKIKEKKN